MVGNVLTPAHLLIVLAVALLVLGPKRLPAAGRGLGEAMRGFKDALTPGDQSDTTGNQISEGARIMEASDAASAGTASHPTPHPSAGASNDGPPSAATTESASWQSSSLGTTSNPPTPTRTGEVQGPSDSGPQTPSTREGTEPTDSPSNEHVGRSRARAAS